MTPTDYIPFILETIPKDALIVSSHTTNTNALLIAGERERAFAGLNMGFAHPVGTGLALALPHRRVIILDGDGGTLLGSPSITDLGSQSPKNVIVVVSDNQSTHTIFPSHTAKSADIETMARAAGIRNTATVRDLASFKREFKAALRRRELSYIVAKTEPGRLEVPKNIKEPHLFEAKFKFIRHIEDTEKIKII